VIKDPGVRLHDIHDAITAVQAAVGAMTLAEYAADWKTRRAAERAIEIISEASRYIPQELKLREPAVPWREIAGIGNLLRHEYHRVDDSVIHTIVTRQLTGLKEAVERLLAGDAGG
jgi:uncharacterized protein with HEPN domain